MKPEDTRTYKSPAGNMELYFLGESDVVARSRSSQIWEST